MPYYTCSNAACPSGGAKFSLTSAGQTFCPQCFTKALTPAAAPVRVPQTLTRLLPGSNAMDKAGNKQKPIITTLISLWDLDGVSETEAKKKADHLYTTIKKTNRIDREGQVTGPDGTVTHGKFRLQIGSKTLAGIRLKVGEALDPATIRRAWRESVVGGRYVEVYLGVPED